MPIVASYLYSWLITENRDSLTPEVLILVGISAATGLGSQVAGGPKTVSVLTVFKWQYGPWLFQAPDVWRPGQAW